MSEATKHSPFNLTWRMEPLLEENDKELASSTLRSIALNYIQRSSPPKALVKALNGLKKRDDIVITKPDKGSGVVVMDKTDYIRLLSTASVDITSKFIHADDKRPKSRGRPSKHYHRLLQKEKELRTTLREILPEEIADTLSPKSSRLAHLYGLPKTHKATLSMRPILSATGTYNYKLAKWLEEKLKPLSINEYTITDAFVFADEILTCLLMKMIFWSLMMLQLTSPMCRWMRPSTSWSTKPSRMTGLIKPMGLTSKKISLLSCLKLPQPINFFSLMVSCMSKRMERLWALPLAP